VFGFIVFSKYKFYWEGDNLEIESEYPGNKFEAQEV
jgi:hypothetical protein